MKNMELSLHTDDRADPVKAADAGLLVTNHLNLMYMLAAGLVMPPEGFGSKYYQDTLGVFPGWIPLFIGSAPGDAIESSTAEAKHLRPVIAEVALAGLSGWVMASREDGVREMRFPDQWEGSERAILVPAPLPASWIGTVFFRSDADRRACDADAQDYGNVPLRGLKRKTKKTLFTKALQYPWLPKSGPPERTTELHTPLAAGGIMAMLAHCANRGTLAAGACRGAFDPDDSAQSLRDPVFAGLPEWMRTGSAPSPAAMDAGVESDRLRDASQARLFWDAVDRLVDWQRPGTSGSAEDVLLDHLQKASRTLDARLQAGVGRLVDTLHSLTGLADATAGELFQRHETPLARAMTLFFLRRDCVDLLDFGDGRLSEPDWLAAAILFGVRDGWLALPLRLRDIPGLSDAVCHRMAQMSHRIAGSAIDLGNPPARIRSLREWFGDGSTWGAKEKSAALHLARTHKWSCISTRIVLGRDTYQMTIAGGHIELSGDPKVIKGVEPERFLDHLAGLRRESGAEAKVRKMLMA